MTWRLHKIVLYSHDGRHHQLPEVGFKEIGVSIIVGDSNTGKSAVLEIVNYCLGSTHCEIADYVRQRCSWVGTQLRREKQFLLLCRQIPAKSRKSTSAFFLKTGTSDDLPLAEELLDMGAGVLEQFDQLLGIGAIKLDDPASVTGGFSVSGRHCLPYSLVRDDVIISKDVLISGARDERGRHLRETLPYFLGHVTEETIRMRVELRRRRAELRARQAEFDQRQILAREGSVRLSSFVDKARSLGLIGSAVSANTADEKRSALEDVAGFRAGKKVEQPESERYALEEELTTIRRNITQLQERRRAVRQTATDAATFWSAASGQFGRLAVIDLLNDEGPSHRCPVCRADLKKQAEPLPALHDAMEKLRQDIGEVAYDRPRLDGYLLELDQKIEALKIEQERMVARIEELIRLDAEVERERGLEEARLRLSGQVEMFLASSEVEDLAAERAELALLKGTIAKLEEGAAREAVTESMDDDAVILSSSMKEVIADLPFAAAYRASIPVFDWKNLQVNLLVNGRRKVVMPAIGSDENYLAIHLAFFLSIQKLFAERHRPVLRFIVLDQVTRPYFPDTDYKQVVDLTSADAESKPVQEPKLSDERAKVRKIFDKLFKEAALPNAPQIIICEKATFRDNPVYTDAIMAVWMTPNGLVPRDWPSAD